MPGKTGVFSAFGVEYCLLNDPSALKGKVGKVMRPVLLVFLGVLFVWLSCVPAVHADDLRTVVSEWQSLRREDVRADFARYQRFLARYPNWPQARKIRTHAERVMPSDLSPRDVMAFYYDAEPVTGNGMRAYVFALHQIGRDQTAAGRLRSWYANAYLGDEDQTIFLTAYKSVLSPFTARRRIDYLMDTNQDEKALSIARIIGPSDMRDISVWRQIKNANNHDALLKINIGGLSKEWRSNIGIWADLMTRYRRFGSVDEWLSAFKKAPQKIPDAPGAGTFANEHQALIYRLLDTGRAPDAYFVAEAVDYTDPERRDLFLWYQGYIAFDHLKQPGRAFQRFESLYKQSGSIFTRTRAAYYAGLSSDALGYPDVAKAWYKIGAQYGYFYYGQLAREKIKDEAYIDDTPLSASREMKRKFDEDLRVRAALMLSDQGRGEDARLFIRALSDEIFLNDPKASKNKSPAETAQQARLVLDLAYRIKAYPDVVRIARQSARAGIDMGPLAYPMPSFVRVADGMDPAVVFAIIRQESAFDPVAISPSGARGLMQIMPGTAADMARRYDISHHVDWLTARPAHNLRLGQVYMKSLLDRFDGSLALAAAAYNAGPRRVNEWLSAYGDPRSGDISERAFVERIPYTETRLYVQRVVEGAISYRLHH